MKPLFPLFILSLSIALASCQDSTTPAAAPATDLPTLKVDGDHFVDAKGETVRFWGVNLVSLYPEHTTADNLAANLASLGVNLARPHHNLRPSKDWNPQMQSGALLDYKQSSREFDPIALDRFDYLNAALRRHNIYLALSVNWTRRYLPGDAVILPSDEKDKAAWKAALAELSGWDWKKAFDVYKMLPCVDERAALLNEEFIKTFLTHVNPYTGISYAADPQVITFEILNEASTEYAVICGNRLPDYWQAKLVEKWNAYAKEAGIEPGDLYKPANPKAKEVRAKFLRQLDEAYLERITKVIRATGSQAAVAFSNLWRGETIAEMNTRTAGFIEDHMYMDPMVVASPDDGFYKLTRSALVKKPFFVGELNQAEGAENIKRQSATRAMLPIATAAYASLQDWSGIVWFAWQHGEKAVGETGWAKEEARHSDLGQMIADGQMIDHVRTTGIIFRRGLVDKSREPITLWVDEPYFAGDYNGLMRGKYSYKPGWQNVHAVRKAFGPVPESQATAPWMTQSPPNPIVSDTKQIFKDTVRKQLTVAAPQTEAFSGFLDGQPPAGLQHLGVEGEGFATVVLVADDNKPLAESSSLIISRTGVNADNTENNGPRLKLNGLKKPSTEEHWYLTPTRPRTSVNTTPRKIEPAADGSLELAPDEWRECELHLRP